MAGALVVGACGEGGATSPAGEPAAGAEDPAARTPAPREPAEIVAGCGNQAATPSTDLSAARLLARCGPGAPAAVPLAAPATVRLAVPLAVTESLAPVLLADRFDEYAAERLTVELAPMAPADAFEALAAGEVDAVASDLDAGFLDAVHDGSPARVVFGGVLSRAPNNYEVAQDGLWVRVDALDEDKLSDLEMQPVGVPGGMTAAATYPIGQVLGQTQITLNEVALADAGGGDAARRLGEGELAAAWLDGGAWYPFADDEAFELVATLPSSESIGGIVAGERLLGPDRAVGVAFVRAMIRTINTYLTGDYRADDEVTAALAAATGVDAAVLAELPPPLFDWEVRDGTLGRAEEALMNLGATTYDVPTASDELVDRTLASDAIGAPRPR